MQMMDIDIIILTLYVGHCTKYWISMYIVYYNRKDFFLSNLDSAVATEMGFLQTWFIILELWDRDPDLGVTLPSAPGNLNSLGFGGWGAGGGGGGGGGAPPAANKMNFNWK